MELYYDFSRKPLHSGFYTLRANKADLVYVCNEENIWTFQGPGNKIGDSPEGSGRWKLSPCLSQDLIPVENIFDYLEHEKARKVKIKEDEERISFIERKIEEIVESQRDSI